MTIRFAALLATVAVVAGVAGAAVAPSESSSTPRVRFSYHQDTFTRSRRPVLAGGRPLVVQHLPIVAHGGTVAIQWYDGAWAPHRPSIGSYAGIWVDDKERSSGLIGANTGRFETRPAVVMWTGQLTPGRHVVEVRVTRSDPGFLLPQASPATPVVDGVYVTEYTS